MRGWENASWRNPWTWLVAALCVASIWQHGLLPLLGVVVAIWAGVRLARLLARHPRHEPLASGGSASPFRLSMASLNGWQRLWVALSVGWLIVVAVLTYFT